MLIIPIVNNPIISGISGLSFESEGYSCNSNDTRYVGTGFASADTIGSGQAGETPLPAALPLFASGLGAMGVLARRRKRKNAVAAIAAR